MSYSIGADSEFGRLRAVLMHRPGPELKRVTPRTRDLLGFDGTPWAARAQQEHDFLADVLRTRGAEVIYLTELLADVLQYQAARDASIGSVLANSDLGDELAGVVRNYLGQLCPEDLAGALIAGLTPDELHSGRGLVYDLLDPHDFVIAPLPNLVFSTDASTWVADRVVVGTLAGTRHRETDLVEVVYRHHPRFSGQRQPYRAARSYLDGGDVVLLGPGAVAVGVGVRSTPASVELLARHLLDAGAAGAVLAVPMNQRARGSHLDTACTVLAAGVVLIAPGLAFTLTALTITSRGGELRVSRPRPFLEAAARAIGLDRLTVIDTGGRCDGGQWDDGGNALAIGDRTVICDERNSGTNVRLASAGFEVITVPNSELGRLRGGPRSMCTPLLREPATQPETGQPAPADQPAADRPPAQRELAPLG